MSKNWTTKDGQEIPISELKDQHLLNIHRMLRQTIENTKCYTDVIGACWAPKGEMACEAFEQEMDNQFEAEMIAIARLKLIDKEVKKRGLTKLPLKDPHKPMPKMRLVEDLGYGQVYEKVKGD